MPRYIVCRRPRYDVDPQQVWALLSRLGDAVERDTMWLALSKLLTGIGGYILVVPLELEDGDLHRLVHEGQVFEAKGARFIRGPASECHGTVLRLHARGGCRRIATGYALSDDGLWRQHSWGIDSAGRVVEPTALRTAYYGVLMPDEDVPAFRKQIAKTWGVRMDYLR